MSALQSFIWAAAALAGCGAILWRRQIAHRAVAEPRGEAKNGADTVPLQEPAPPLDGATPDDWDAWYWRWAHWFEQQTHLDDSWTARPSSDLSAWHRRLLEEEPAALNTHVHLPSRTCPACGKEALRHQAW